LRNGPGTQNQNIRYRPGVSRPLADYDELPNDELRVDGMAVVFPQCWVKYNSNDGWDRICRAIAPSLQDGSTEDHAFTHNGNELRRKRSPRSMWFHSFWAAELRHYPTERGGRLEMRLNINPTRREAFRSLGRPHPKADIEQYPMPSAAKADILRDATLDGSTNFIPTHFKRYTFQSRMDALADALSEFKEILMLNLRRAEVEVIDGADASRSQKWTNRTPQIGIHWNEWRVDRIEQYVDLLVDDPWKVVRLGYLDARARFNPSRTSRPHPVQSTLYPPRDIDQAQLATDLDRNRRALSYSVKISASNNVSVYAKTPKIVRVERRWVRGTGNPEVRFAPYQSQGLVGLANWVAAMNPGSSECIHPVECRLASLANSAEDGLSLWCDVMSLAVRRLGPSGRLEGFIKDVVELNGLHRPTQPRPVQLLLKTLIEHGLFEQLDRRENVTPVPALLTYLRTLREVGEIEACRMPSGAPGVGQVE
jgi:hypothetical protein